MSILDGIVRLFLGCIIGATFGAIGGWIGLFGLVTPFFIVTGMGGFCPVYYMLGWSTLEDPETNDHHSAGSVTKTLDTTTSAKRAA